MRLRFWKKEADFFDEIPRAKRPRETLTQLSEKLIMKQMKADPTYGLQIAEKVKKVAKVEDKSLLSQVKELRQIQTALRELGVGGAGEGQQGMLAGLFDRETVQTILATIIQTLSKQPRQTLPQAEQPQLTQPEQQQLPQETIRMPKLDELLLYLEEEPQDIVSMLKERKDEQAKLWLTLLSKSSYRQICTLLRPLQEQNPELESLLADLLHENREKWWRELLEAAKRAI